jgi:hypothetical protein
MDSLTFQKIVDQLMPRNGIAQDGSVTLENARWIVPFKHLLYGKIQAFISDRLVQTEDVVNWKFIARDSSHPVLRLGRASYI